MFLGVTLDPRLTFRAHIETAQIKGKTRATILRALSGTSWGCKKEDLKLVYKTFIASAFEYCAAAWMSRTAATNLQKIQGVQNLSARGITGCCRSTPEGPLIYEAGLEPVKTRARFLTCCAYEKALRLPESNPLQAVSAEDHPVRLTSQRSWCVGAKEACETAGLNILPREPFEPISPVPPWRAPKNVAFKPDLIQWTRRQDPPDLRKEVAQRTLDRLPPPDFEVWTDGSAEGGTRQGGSGVLILDHTNQSTHELSYPAGVHTSSYRAETVALVKALDWCAANVHPGVQHVRICLDSKSVIQRLSSGPTRIRSQAEGDIWRKLIELEGISAAQIIIQWVPGHAGLAGNERSDRLANDGRLKDQQACDIDYPTAKAHLHRLEKTKWKNAVEHDNLPLRVPNPPSAEAEASLSKRETQILSQLRTGGHSPILQEYLHRINRAPTPECLTCGHPMDDLDHMLTDCPAYDHHRLQRFGLLRPPISILWRQPCDVINFLKDCGRIPSGSGRRL